MQYICIVMYGHSNTYLLHKHPCSTLEKVSYIGRDLKSPHVYICIQPEDDRIPVETCSCLTKYRVT